MRRLRPLSLLTFAVLLLAASFGAGLPVTPFEPAPASAQITPLDEEPVEAPGLGDITGSPEAGPDPEDAGDRGGFAQLTLAVVLGFAVLFIGSRLIRAARANQSP